MESELNLSLFLENQFHEVISNAIENAINRLQPKDWMNLKEGAAYTGVSINTFKKFRENGLKVSEVGGVLRVSKAEIDSFLEANSY